MVAGTRFELVAPGHEPSMFTITPTRTNSWAAIVLLKITLIILRYHQYNMLYHYSSEGGQTFRLYTLTTRHSKVSVDFQHKV